MAKQSTPLDKTPLYYSECVSPIRKLVNKRFKKVNGVNSVAVNLRVVNPVVAYEFVDSEIESRSLNDLIYPAEVGLKNGPAHLLNKKMARIYLELRKAEADIERKVAKIFPGLDTEWVMFLQDSKKPGICTPIPY